jgi:hypothetical protein
MTTFGDQVFQFGGVPVSSNNLPFTPANGRYWFVDGTSGVGSDGNSGKKPSDALATIQQAVTNAVAGDVVVVFPKKITDFTGDPTSYAETVIIPAGKPHLSIVGVSHGLTQGGLPQIRKNSGSTALITVRSPGCLISNLGLNGAGSTGGGILLDDDNSTKAAFGTTITGCHFKNCKGHATDGRLGGGIMWSAQGNAWQVRIKGNHFYKNVADIVLLGTANTVPQDVLIEDNLFSGPAASVDVNLYLGAGSGMNGVVVNRNVFLALPAIGSGSVARYLDMTGCTGMITNCVFGCLENATATELTFTTAGTGGKIPATVFVANCWGQSSTAGEVAYVAHT